MQEPWLILVPVHLPEATLNTSGEVSGKEGGREEGGREGGRRKERVFVEEVSDYK